MGPIFNFTTDFNCITKQDVSDVNLPPLRESSEKVCFIYIIFHGVSRGYETVYRSRLEARGFFRRAIGLRGKPIVMTSILEQLYLHGSGCHAFRDLAGKSTRKPLVRPSTMRQGQKLELEEIAQGQRAQADVLGQDRVLTTTLVQKLLKTIQDKPEIVSLIGRLVPQTVVSTGGQGTGLDSAAAIIGALLSSGSATTPALAGPSTKK